IFRLLVVSFVVMSAAALAQAQGIIVPGPCQRCPDLPRPVNLPRSLPINPIKIDAKISSQLATTHIEQVFRNDSNATLEGTYFFPIPETASTVDVAFWAGE